MQKKKSPFLMQRNWRGATTSSSSERKSRDYSAPRNRSRSSYRSTSSSYSCGGSSSRRPQPEGRDPSSIRPEEVTCHGMQVTNLDNYIANLFR